MKRRKFLITAAIGAATLAWTGSHREREKKTISIHKGAKVKLNLATAWPAHYPILGTGIDDFAKRCEVLSDGTLEINIFPKNILLPASRMFNATSAGEIDAFHSGNYRWEGKNPEFSIFGSIPQALSSQEMIAWLKEGGGYPLWREIYATFNLYPLIGGTTGMQMGGWFTKEIHSLSDMQGLKMRFPSLDGEVMQRLGVDPVHLLSEEILTSLENGTIDAAQWAGPYLDRIVGFDKVAPYYYTRWRASGSILELTFNKARWENLSKEHQAIITIASQEMTHTMLQEFDYKNTLALQELSNSVHIKAFSSEIIDASNKALSEVLTDEGAKSADFKRVLRSYEAFVAQSKPLSAKYF